MAKKPRLLTYDGRTMSLTAWAEEIGLTSAALAYRLDLGWSVADALTTPPRSTGPRNAKCKRCRYGRKLTRWGGDWFCDYQRIAGHRRPCRAAACRGYPREGKHNDQSEV